MNRSQVHRFVQLPSRSPTWSIACCQACPTDRATCHQVASIECSTLCQGRMIARSFDRCRLPFSAVAPGGRTICCHPDQPFHSVDDATLVQQKCRQLLRNASMNYNNRLDNIQHGCKITMDNGKSMLQRFNYFNSRKYESYKLSSRWNFCLLIRYKLRI